MARMPGNPPAPSTRVWRAFTLNSSNGLERSMRFFLASSSRRCCICQEPAPGPRPPSNSGLALSAITLARSKVHLLPSPWHSSQAPYGLLKENERGSNCGILAPHSVHASFCEYRRSSPLTTTISTRPPASLVAVSMDASRRFSMPGFTSRSWSGEVLDLRSLMPWDKKAVIDSVRRTGHLVIVEENQYSGGWGTEIASHVMAKAFSDLQAPVLRITAPDVPVPYGLALEQRFLPSPEYVTEQVSALLATK